MIGNILLLWALLQGPFVPVPLTVTMLPQGALLVWPLDTAVNTVLVERLRDDGRGWQAIAVLYGHPNTLNDIDRYYHAGCVTQGERWRALLYEGIGGAQVGETTETAVYWAAVPLVRK